MSVSRTSGGSVISCAIARADAEMAMWRSFRAERTWMSPVMGHLPKTSRLRLPPWGAALRTALVRMPAHTMQQQQRSAAMQQIVPAHGEHLLQRLPGVGVVVSERPSRLVMRSRPVVQRARRWTNNSAAAWDLFPSHAR